MTKTPLLTAFSKTRAVDEIASTDAAVLPEASTDESAAERRLEAICAAVERAHPSIHVDRPTFVEYVGAHPGVALDSLADDAAAEIYLAAALHQGIAAAHAIFDATYLASLDRRIGQLRLSDADLDEIKQRTREKLLIPDESGRLRIESYAGKGRLLSLVRVVATREALTLKRRARREVPLDHDDLAEPVAGAWDPGIEMLKGRARDAFREAFERGVMSLTARDRNLLRLHLLGGVTLEKLAAMYDVHRATIVRWLAAARAAVLEETRRGLGAELGLGATELESLMVAVQSRLDVSVERMLASVP